MVSSTAQNICYSHTQYDIERTKYRRYKCSSERGRKNYTVIIKTSASGPETLRLSSTGQTLVTFTVDLTCSFILSVRSDRNPQLPQGMKVQVPLQVQDQGLYSEAGP